MRLLGKPTSLLTSFYVERLVSTCIASFEGISEGPFVAWDQMDYISTFSTQFLSRSPREWLVSSLDHLAYGRLPQTSVSNQSVKVVTSGYGCSLRHLLIPPYPPLLATISQDPGQVRFHGFTHFIVSGIRRNRFSIV